MTKIELIEALSDFNDDMEIKFSYNYGDYWNTKVANNINNIDIQRIKYSSYHGMDKIVIEDENEDEDNDNEEVIILS